MDNKVIDFTGSNIYARLDVHKKSWYVTILKKRRQMLKDYINKQLDSILRFHVHENGLL